MRTRRYDLKSVSVLEPTFSLEDTRAYLGCEATKLAELIRLGLKYGARLHPTKGGLFPTFKVSHKNRRVTLSAIDRHKRHMARLAGEAEPPATVVYPAAA